jgi:hypothetical protein
MRFKSLILAGAGALATLGGAAAVFAQGKPAGGQTVYWMSADTSSGMAGMAHAAGDPSAVMAMMRGGQGSYSHNLALQLGSPKKPAGEASAEHLPPQGLRAGMSLPLVTPRGAAPAPTSWNGQYEKPKGRMLIYWGCGDKARPGQPTVVDFASLAAGKVPPALASAIRAMMPPAPGRHATYGEWPNERARTRVPAGASLVGAHKVRGNYSPEISFALAQGQDFLAPVALTSQAPAASGAVPLAWRPVAGSKAWLAGVMGAAQNGDLILWTSSEKPMGAMGMGQDYIAEGDVAGLIQQKVLMPAAADRCTVPAEVGKATRDGGMLTLTAFGGETNLSQPRPAGAAPAWKPEWAVKLRTKSTYSGMLGMDMSDMMGDDAGDEEEQEEASYREERAPAAKKKRGRLGGALGAILGN